MQNQECRDKNLLWVSAIVCLYIKNGESYLPIQVHSIISFFSLQIFVLQLSLASNKLPAQEHNFVFFFSGSKYNSLSFCVTVGRFFCRPPAHEAKKPHFREQAAVQIRAYPWMLMNIVIVNLSAQWVWDEAAAEMNNNNKKIFAIIIAPIIRWSREIHTWNVWS